jgi:hypothetical protein
MLAAEKSKDTFIAPIGIGLSLFVVEIAGVNYSGASVNPARSFGPCVAAADFPGYFWIYFVGPILGALLAAGFYHFVKVCTSWRWRWSGWIVGCSWSRDLTADFRFNSFSTTKTQTLVKTALARTRSSISSLRKAIWRMGGEWNNVLGVRGPGRNWERL